MKTNVYKIFSVFFLLTFLLSGSACADTITSPDTTGTLTMTLVIAPYASVTTAPASKDLTYNGTSQDLVTAGTATGGKMVYALGSADIATTSYDESIPTGTNAGTYYVWYKVSADSGYRDSAALSLDVTISKAASSVTTAPASYDLEYDSYDQDLVTAGAASGGTIYYALGSDDKTAPVSYDTTIPQATDEGTYYVWYKVVGDENHTDTDAQCITAVITLVNYTISYSGLTNMTTDPTSYNMKSPDINLSIPTRSGYTFAGWTGTDLTEASVNVTIPSGSSGNRSYWATWNVITYRISFDLGGGHYGGTNPLDYTCESDEITPDTPARDGYDFEGWVLSGDETGTVYQDLTIPNGTTGDLEYIAQWSLHVYTLSYDLEGGTVSPENPTRYTIESDDIILTSPDRTAYDFAGWKLSGDTEISTDVTIPHGSSGDRLYTATWTVITYGISYDLNNGTLSSANPTSYDVESADIKLNNPTRTGYTFAGWTGTGLTEASTDVTIPNGSSGDRIYTATWTNIVYTISYTMNNSEVSGNPTSYTIDTGTFTLNNPAKNGYTFDGWTGTDLSGKTQTVTVNQGSTGDRSYTANFTPIEYTITYELNGGTNNDENPASYTIESASITLQYPTKNGYTFTGWTGSNGTDPETNVTISKGSTGTRTYAANWTLIQYKISFDLDGGEFGDQNPTTYNYETETFTLNNPTKNGYEFTGWSLEGETDLSMDVEIPQGSTGDLKYTANWKTVTYSISYELKNGTVSPDNPSSYDIETETFTLNNPVLTGYTFDGWTGTSLDQITQTVTISQGSTGDRSYAAEWILNVYTLSYDLDGGTVSQDNPTEYTVESEDIKLNRPAKTGYEFAGWSFDNEISLDVTIPKGSTGNREYTANWLIQIPVPVLTCSNPDINVKKGGTIASLTVSSDVTPQEWLTEGELPGGLAYRTDGNDFIISGTVSADSETGDYVYTVRAKNEAGISDPVTITITVTGAGSETTDYTEVPAGEISGMTDEEIAETFSDTTNIALTGEAANLSETIARLESLTNVKNLDLSQITGVSELKLENTKLESITLEGNQSVKQIEITGNDTLTALNLSGSKAEFVDVSGCEKLEEVNLEGCEDLEYLDVSETPITSLNAQDCKNLGILNCSSCDIIDLKIDGCEKLSELDCSNNSLTRLDLNDFDNLSKLECRNQNVRGLIRSRRLNILDILFLRIFDVSPASETETEADSAANVKNIKAYDDNGREISAAYDNETGEVAFAEIPSEIKYNYVTGFNGILMDVTVSNEESNEDENVSPGNPRSGCNTNFGAGIMTLMFLCVYGVFVRKSK